MNQILNNFYGDNSNKNAKQDKSKINNQFDNIEQTNPYNNMQLNNPYGNIEPNYNSTYENNFTNNYGNSFSSNTFENNYEKVSSGRKAEKVEIKKIVKIFSICCIVLGTLIAGKSVYALTIGRTKPKDTVQVSTDKMGKEVTISIETQMPIKEFKYKWNDGEETVVEGDGTVNVSETIDIPNGNNILKISVIDYYGNKTEYQKQYIYESTDIIKPTIKLEILGSKLKITATDETKMLYMTYQWNDEDVTRIDAQEGEKVITEEIEVSKGTDKLTIVAVDGEENKETVTKTIVGANKPTFTMSTEDKSIVIRASDEEGIKSISVTVDGETTTSSDINQKDITAKLPLSQGNHTISVTVTNINDQTTTKELSATI